MTSLARAAAYIALTACTMPLWAADALTADPADAESDNTVIVQARSVSVDPLRAEKDVPKSVTVVSGQELASLDALNVTDVFQRLGNIRWNFGNPTTGSITVRGITTSASGSTIDPSLGITVDGVPYGTVPLAAGTDFIDVDTFSVLRGPQGSQGGQNTTVGTIDVVNKAPTFTPEGSASVTLGERSAVITQGVLGGPIINDLIAYRLTASRDQEQGSYYNSYADNFARNSWGNVDRTFARAQLLFTPADTLRILASFNIKPKGTEYANGLTQQLQQPAYYANGQPTYIANGLPGVTNTVQNKLTRGYFTDVDPLAYQHYLAYPVYLLNDRGQEIGTSGGVLRLDWVSPFGTLNSTAGIERQYFQASNGSTAWDVSYDSGYQIDYNQVSEELSLSSKPTSFLDSKVGLYYFRARAVQDVRTRLGTDAGAYYANPAQYTALQGNLGLLKDSLDRSYTEAYTYESRRSAAAFANLDWHLSEPLTLTTGIRATREHREALQNKLVTDSGFGALLNPAAYGGFNSSATGALTTETAAQLAAANQLAAKYYGAASYSALSAAQQSAVAQAKALRASQVFNQLYGTTAAQPYDGTLTSGIASLSYQFDPEVTGYLTYQHGVKAGISQISGVDRTGLPISRLVAPESSNSFELGVKGDLWQSLVVNADLFYDRLRNFQQSVYIEDPVLTAQAGTLTYTSISGNAPLVISRGAEVDAAYSGIRNLTVRLAGAYNDAYYASSLLLAQPVEKGNLSSPFYDANGQQLPNVQRFSGNLSGVYTIPILGNKVVHVNGNYHYGSRRSTDASGSIYGVIGGYGTADLGIGFGRTDGIFDVTVLLKNAFDKQFNETQTWTSYTPGLGRWVGVMLSGHL